MTELVKRPKVLISGVAGYIASHAALEFLQEGWDVIGIDDLSVGRLEVVPSGVDFYQVNCRSPKVVDLARSYGIDVAVHFAGRIRVDESITFPFMYYDTNVSAATTFFDSVARAGIKGTVFSSTAAVYEESTGGKVDENHATVPVSPYGRSKLAAEWALKDLCLATQMRRVTLRYFNVAGADGQLRTGPRRDAHHLIKAVSEAAVGLRDRLEVFGTDYDTPDGTCVRDYIHVSDLASAHVSAANHLLNGGDNVTLNCGYGRGISVLEVINEAKKLAIAPLDIVFSPRRAGDLVSVVADTRRLRDVLGWQPKYDSLEYILKTAIAWEQKCLEAS